MVMNGDDYNHEVDQEEEEHWEEEEAGEENVAVGIYDEEPNEDGNLEIGLQSGRGYDVGSATVTGTGVSSLEIVNVGSQSDEDADAAVAVEEQNGSGCQRNNAGSQGGTGLSAQNENDGGQIDRDEIDGLFCPICLEAWSSGGEHQVCCLPCGHIYGLSCIKKWLSRQGSNKCPQCKKKCRSKDIRLLYASQIVAIDGEIQKKVQFLEAKCDSLERKKADWSRKEAEWKKRESYLKKKLESLKKRNRELEHLLEREPLHALGPSMSCHNNRAESSSGLEANSNNKMCSNKFKLQKDFHLHGARLFDFAPSSQMFVVARRLLGQGGMHVLTKVSLLSDGETEDIQLPVNSKAIKDLQVSPHGRLVMLAFLGKKLSILSTESNNTILTYDLPAAAWSCAWDNFDSHYVYTGLQNGTVLQFDMRQTVRYSAALTAGSTYNPIHTLGSIPSFLACHTTVLTASSAGLCRYEFNSFEQRPCSFPESETYGVCISASYSKSGDHIVASYRPRIEMSMSQQASSQQPQSTIGSHVVYRKIECWYEKLGVTCGSMNVTRLPRSAIIEGIYQNPVFVSADESTNEIVFQELPSFTVMDRILPQKYPIRDIKFNRGLSSGTLGCLCDESVHLFTASL